MRRPSSMARLLASGLDGSKLTASSPHTVSQWVFRASALPKASAEALKTHWDTVWGEDAVSLQFLHSQQVMRGIEGHLVEPTQIGGAHVVTGAVQRHLLVDVDVELAGVADDRHAQFHDVRILVGTRLKDLHHGLAGGLFHLPVLVPEHSVERLADRADWRRAIDHLVVEAEGDLLRRD